MKMKKLAVLLAAITLTSGATALAGCNQTAKEEKVMNLSLNPEVEFVLDENDNVVSVNALNEEGNLIISAEVFVGKSAEEAAKLFVEVSKETGFLVTGTVNTDENELEISFSGDTKAAETLYNEVKSEVESYLSSENITATLTQAAAITEEKLQALVAECAPYLEQAEIQAMKYEELMAELKASRQETAEFYSQELKNAYYEAKAFAMEKAELETIKSKLDTIGQAAVNFAYSVYEDAVELIETTRMNVLVKEDSPYQLALKAFREAKVDYLNFRNEVAAMEQTEITTAITDQLAQYDQLVEDAETALLNAGASANSTLDTVKGQVESAYNSVITLIGDYSAKVTQYAEDVSTDWQAAKAQFFTDFETNYAAAITAAENNWSDMKTELENGGSAE